MRTMLSPTHSTLPFCSHHASLFDFAQAHGRPVVFQSVDTSRQVDSSSPALPPLPPPRSPFLISLPFLAPSLALFPPSLPPLPPSLSSFPSLPPSVALLPPFLFLLLFHLPSPPLTSPPVPSPPFFLPFPISPSLPSLPSSSPPCLLLSFPPLPSRLGGFPCVWVAPSLHPIRAATVGHPLFSKGG